MGMLATGKADAAPPQPLTEVAGQHAGSTDDFLRTAEDYVRFHLERFLKMSEAETLIYSQTGLVQ